jgi:hypothetical protein
MKFHMAETPGTPVACRKAGIVWWRMQFWPRKFSGDNFHFLANTPFFHEERNS